MRGAWAAIAALLLGAFAFGASLSPWVVLGVEALVVAIVDVLGLSALARRRTRGTAMRCAVIGLIALIAQAGGDYLSLFVVWDWLVFDGSGWLFWTLPAMAVLLAAALLARRSTRLHGWAVLIGSAQGFMALVAFFVAVFAACNCMD